MKFLYTFIGTIVAIAIAAYLLPGVTIATWESAVIVAVALGIVNMLVKPILQVLTFPITIVTLGLWLFVINALMVMLVAAIVPGFDVAGFFSALIFSIILSIITGFLQKIGNSHSE